jgi:hypothetical protein
MLFTRVAPCAKSKGLPIGGPLLSKTLMLFTRVAPHTKSKGLSISAPQIFYYFQHTLRHVQKARGYIGMYSKFIILLIKFPKVFCSSAGVIIPLYHPNNKPSNPDRWFNILLVYTCYQYIRSKGHLFIFIFIKFIQHAKEKYYKALGLSLSSDSTRLVKSYEDTKSWAVSNALETKVSRSASSTVKYWRRSSMFRSGR